MDSSGTMHKDMMVTVQFQNPMNQSITGFVIEPKKYGFKIIQQPDQFDGILKVNETHTWNFVVQPIIKGDREFKVNVIVGGVNVYKAQQKVKVKGQQPVVASGSASFGFDLDDML